MPLKSEESLSLKIVSVNLTCNTNTVTMDIIKYIYFWLIQSDKNHHVERVPVGVKNTRYLTCMTNELLEPDPLHLLLVSGITQINGNQYLESLVQLYMRNLNRLWFIKNNSAWFKRNLFYTFSLKTSAKTFNMVAIRNMKYLFMIYRRRCNNYVTRKRRILATIILKLQKHKQLFLKLLNIIKHKINLLETLP